MSQPMTELGMLCRTCGNDRAWHESNETRHPYNDGSLPTAATFGRKLPGGGRGPGTAPGEETAVEQSQWPFDPVLRQALINKGVITPEDLRDAELMIRAVTAQILGGPPNVQGADVPRRADL